MSRQLSLDYYEARLRAIEARLSGPGLFALVNREAMRQGKSLTEIKKGE